MSEAGILHIKSTLLVDYSVTPPKGLRCTYPAVQGPSTSSPCPTRLVTHGYDAEPVKADTIIVRELDVLGSSSTGTHNAAAGSVQSGTQRRYVMSGQRA